MTSWTAPPKAPLALNSDEETGNIKTRFNAKQCGSIVFEFIWRETVSGSNPTGHV